MCVGHVEFLPGDLRWFDFVVNTLMKDRFSSKAFTSKVEETILLYNCFCQNAENLVFAVLNE